MQVLGLITHPPAAHDKMFATLRHLLTSLIDRSICAIHLPAACPPCLPGLACLPCLLLITPHTRPAPGLLLAALGPSAPTILLTALACGCWSGWPPSCWRLRPSSSWLCRPSPHGMSVHAGSGLWTPLPCIGSNRCVCFSICPRLPAVGCCRSLHPWSHLTHVHWTVLGRQAGTCV